MVGEQFEGTIKPYEWQEEQAFQLIFGYFFDKFPHRSRGFRELLGSMDYYHQSIEEHLRSDFDTLDLLPGLRGKFKDAYAEVRYALYTVYPWQGEVILQLTSAAILGAYGHFKEYEERYFSTRFFPEIMSDYVM